LLAGPLPSGESFDVIVAVPEADAPRPTGSLHIWPPRQGQCSEEPPTTGDQVHHVALIAENNTLKGRVQPLQVAQTYCVLVQYSQGIVANQRTRIARAAAAQLLEELLNPPPGTDPPPPLPCALPRGGESVENLATHYKAALETAIKADLGNALEVSTAASVAVEVRSSEACKKYNDAWIAWSDADLVADEALSEYAKAADEVARLAAGSSDVGSFRSPLVVVDNLPTLLGKLVSGNPTGDQLDQAERFLTARYSAGSPEHEWLAIVKKLRRADSRESFKEVQDKAEELSKTTALSIHVWDQQVNKLTSFATLAPAIVEVKRDGGAKPAVSVFITPRDVIDALQSATGNNTQLRLRDQWINRLKELERAGRVWSERKNELKKELEDYYAAYDDLRVAVETSFQRGADLNVTRARFELTPTAMAKTDDVGNYVSIDLGALVGVPLVDGAAAGETWIAPYLGVNIYTTPVDRSIAFSSLIGSRWRQRMSITLGLTAQSSTPTIAERATSGPLLSRSPLIALGVRATRGFRVTAGMAFFKVADENPLSGQTELGVAPFIGGSLDLDVIALAQGKLL
jgi:hypothetical protein